MAHAPNPMADTGGPYLPNLRISMVCAPLLRCRRVRPIGRCRRAAYFMLGIRLVPEPGRPGELVAAAGQCTSGWASAAGYTTPGTGAGASGARREHGRPPAYPRAPAP